MPDFSLIPLPALVLLAGIIGLLVGSFLNVVIYRLPIMMERDWRAQCADLAETPTADIPEGRFNLVVPRSRCPSCGAQITAWQNIPVLSYLFLGGEGPPQGVACYDVLQSLGCAPNPACE